MLVFIILQESSLPVFVFGPDQCSTINSCLQVPGTWCRTTNPWPLRTCPSATWLPNEELTDFLHFPAFPSTCEIRVSLKTRPEGWRAVGANAITFHGYSRPSKANLGRLNSWSPHFTATGGTMESNKEQFLKRPHSFHTWPQHHICSPRTPYLRTGTQLPAFLSCRMPSRATGTQQCYRHEFPPPRQLQPPDGEAMVFAALILERRAWKPSASCAGCCLLIPTMPRTLHSPQGLLGGLTVFRLVSAVWGRAGASLGNGNN